MKQLSTSHPSPATGFKPRRLSKLLFSVLLLGQCYRAQAQFPRVESFQGPTAGGFTLGGTAKLTAAAGGSDADGAGYLRLTTAGLNQSGFAIDQSSFPAPNGFSISFEFFAYGGSGADGFSVFLVDADSTSAATFTPGASGGSLGYGQKTIAPVSNGVPFGYIGIGIDEFGNYSNATEGRVGGINTPNQTPDAVAIRGAGNGRSATDYPYLAGTPSLPFSLDVGTTRAQAGSADYRRAYIDVVPTNGTYRITVRIQHGLAIETAVRNFVVPAPPPNLRIGFAGSTGGSTNFHEIRKLAVRQTPFLSDDVVATNYNQAVTINVLANDVFNYANYAPGSVDLDIAQDGIQSSLTLTGGQGTLAVTPAGVVTFTPSGTFAGLVTVPYAAADVLGNVGSPANLVITVRGADIANSVSGPTAVSPGAQVTYTVASTNLGPLPATNLIPTLQLPPNLIGVVASSGLYNPVSGLVTFGAGSLVAGGAPLTNTVSFTAPLTGSVTGTTGNTATEPDPTRANNIASITTLISGLANVADVCAMPGKDGVGTLDATSAPNTYFAGQSVTTGGTTSRIVVGPALTGSGASPTPIVAGDLVLVMQMQGAKLNTTNSAAYGNGTTSGQGNLSGANDQFTAGLYEYAVATNSVDATGGTLTLDRTLTNTYDNLDYDAASNPTGQRRFQVVRVPQYSAVTVADSVAGASWNGAAGGVLVLDVAGRTTFTANALLTMTGRGFRGGGGQPYAGTTATTYTSTDFRQLSSTSLIGSGGAKGEGTAGTPYYVNSTALSSSTQTVASTGQEGYRDGSNGRGAPGNAGGGGTDRTPNDNQRNSGGGGGANGGGGGFGGFAYTYTGLGTDNAQGIGGATFGASAGRLVMGGGGGAGSRNNDGPSSGSRGGGIVLLRTGTVAGPGRVAANGLSAPTTANDGGGGGGAGGAVLLLAANSGTLSALTVTAHGGRGADANLGGLAHGPGGGGGGGVVLASGAVAAASSVAGGDNGLTGGPLLPTSFGATNGTAGIMATTTAATSGSATTECLPTLTVAMSAVTPAVSRIGGATGAVSPATYTLNITNTGGTITGTNVTSILQSPQFKFDETFLPTVTLTMPNGRTVAATGYVPPVGAMSQPEFKGFTMPAGATLTIKFRATIDPSVQNNVPYQASTMVSYNNPLRTSPATAIIQPGQNYAGGADTSLGTAAGSNFNGSLTTAEDVTVIVPLPVSLTRFTTAAQRLDAQLRWTTATELNNDRFVVERSLNGTSFEAVGSVRGQGSSAKPTGYEFLDAGAARLTAAGRPVYYRLRQVDTNGEGTYSPVRSVTFGAKGAITLYPNPAGRAATLDLSGLPAGSYRVQVLDLTGRAVATYSLGGGAQHPLDLQALAAGTYVVRVNGAALSQSLLLTRE